MSLLGALLALLFKQFPDVMNNEQNKISLISSLVIITVLLARISTADINYSTLFRQATGWIIISIFILTGYSYQYELNKVGNRLAANLIPGYGEGNGDGSVTFYAGNNGHFIIKALINDRERIKLLLDTGATMLSLTYRDAEKIGIDVENLEYNSPLNTANGISWAAKVTLKSVQVGPITVNNVYATVSKDGLDTSLLGMSFLRKLKRFNIQRNKLTLVN